MLIELIMTKKTVEIKLNNKQLKWTLKGIVYIVIEDVGGQLLSFSCYVFTVGEVSFACFTYTMTEFSKALIPTF